MSKETLLSNYKSAIEDSSESKLFLLRDLSEIDKLKLEIERVCLPIKYDVSSDKSLKNETQRKSAISSLLSVNDEYLGKVNDLEEITNKYKHDEIISREKSYLIQYAQNAINLEIDSFKVGQ